jgi:hypothetical protein
MLDKTRQALRANGVDFDNHLVVLPTTQNTQGLSAHESHASDGGSSSRESEYEGRKYSPNAVKALRRRISILNPLLSHANLGVRRVVLRHLIDLLRANRGLFHRLIDVEDGASASRFLTIEYTSSGKS